MRRSIATLAAAACLGALAAAVPSSVAVAPSPLRPRRNVPKVGPTLREIARGVDPEIAAWNAAVDRKKAERRGRR